MDKNLNIVAANTSDKAKSIYITMPGLNGEKESISLSLSARPDHYFVPKGDHLVAASAVQQQDPDSWKDKATFRLYYDKFHWVRCN